ncbi:hypothetical protein ACE0DR_26370 [Azotobacter sp. CWF10]
MDDQVDLDGWFKTLAAEMKKQQIHIAGSSLRPANYDVTDVEYGEEMPEVVSAGKAVGSKNNISLNKILYGPPGTGKTYATIDAALEIIEPSALLLERPERHARFRKLVTEKRVRFVTFHQSFSYEDFVEGLRALPPGSDENPGAALSYDVAKGVFVQLCQDAASDPVMGEKLGLKDDPTIWKISIEEASSDGRTRRYCFQQGEARIGWDQTGDLRHANLADPALKLGSNDQGSLDSFVRGIEPGDMLVCLGTRKSICAVGVVTGSMTISRRCRRACARIMCIACR